MSILGSEIEPKNRVLPILRGHFCARYQNEKFFIYDRTHHEALFYAAGKAEGLDFSFAIKQHGMFSFTGLGAEEMDLLREKYGVYGVRNGRICIAGLNHRNVEYVAKSLAAVFKARG